jgi:uncharacterized membrane protein YidH (DUF202 family)
MADIIEILFAFGIVIALFGIIIAGYKYITSLGNPEATEQAKLSLLYSIIGLAAIIIAVAFVRFLLIQIGVTNVNFFGL